jgi:hypothetical protein
MMREAVSVLANLNQSAGMISLKLRQIIPKYLRQVLSKTTAVAAMGRELRIEPFAPDRVERFGWLESCAHYRP